MITPQNIALHEIIGLRTEIVESSNPDFIGVVGTIVNETKSMFVIETENGHKSIPKKHNTWKFFLKDQQQQITISGSLLCKRPEDRLGAKT